MPIALAVHGGAWNIPDEIVAATQRGVRRAVEQGWDALREGASALDVVELVVRTLENDPHFDAGRGSHLNSDGKVEMDASIMDGQSLRAGSVAGVTCLKNPISAARAVMERSPHVMMVGSGAETFARAEGLETADAKQ